LLPVEDHDVLHHCPREEEEIVCGGPEAAEQPPPKSSLFPQSDYPQGHTEDVVHYCEEPHQRTQVEPRPAKERNERSGHHGRRKGNLLNGSLIQGFAQNPLIWGVVQGRVRQRMRNGLLALCQLSPQRAPLELRSGQDSSLDAVEDGLHAAEGVVLSEVELCRRLVAFPDDRKAAVPLVLYLPLWRILLSARCLPGEVLEDHCLSVGVFPSHIPMLLQSYLQGNLLGAIHLIVETSLYRDALGDIGHGPRQIDLEPGAVDVVQGILVAGRQGLELVE
jgi:hypothetical protein